MAVHTIIFLVIFFVTKAFGAATAATIEIPAAADQVFCSGGFGPCPLASKHIVSEGILIDDMHRSVDIMTGGYEKKMAIKNRLSVGSEILIKTWKTHIFDDTGNDSIRCISQEIKQRYFSLVVFDHPDAAILLIYCAKDIIYFGYLPDARDTKVYEGIIERFISFSRSHGIEPNQNAAVILSSAESKGITELRKVLLAKNFTCHFQYNGTSLGGVTLMKPF
jgi:hypothetical protein